MGAESKVKKNLLLFTSGYPAGYGEPFIEYEIPYLAIAFEKILILTTDNQGKENIRPIPGNVSIHYINKKVNWWEKFKGIFQINFWEAFFLDLLKKKQGVNIFSQMKICLDVFAKGLTIFFQAKEVIEREEIIPMNTMLYSYWLDEKALACCLLKKQFKRISCISRAHGWDVFEERHSVPFLPFRAWLFRNLDQVFFVSQDGMDYMNGKHPFFRKSFSVEFLGTASLKKSSHQKKCSQYHIVSCGNLIPLKRIEMVVDSLSLLEESVFWVHFGDGPLLEILKNKAEEVFKNTNSGFWFPGQWPNFRVRQYFGSVHVDLFISLSESGLIGFTLTKSFEVDNKHLRVVTSSSV